MAKRPQKQSDAVSSKARPAPAVAAADAGYFVSDFVPYLLNQTANLYNQAFKQEVRSHGISVTQWRVLAVLNARPDLSLNELAAYTAIDQPTLSRVIDQLVDRTLVTSAPRANDGRFLAISLTAAGRALHEEMWPVAWRHYLRGMSGLSEPERLMLATLLKKVLQSLKPL